MQSIETIGVPEGTGDRWQRGRLLRFVGLSLAAHLALLLVWPGSVPTAMPTSPGGPVAVSLATSAEPAASQTQRREQATQAGARQQADRHEAHETGAAPPATATNAPRKVRQAEPDGRAGADNDARQLHAERSSQRAGAAASPAFDEAHARDRVRAKLRRDLARYFFYPVVAQKRGWQGEVVLAFSLQTDGRITDISVARSSGHATLDRSAVEALSRVNELAVEEGWPPRALRQVRIPVVYRLEG